ncbi:DUF3048 domain-containing protein [Patescibacteria group bacterium]|nr:DUF3048 domain-containing protein [Patescibacteria group bacterium]
MKIRDIKKISLAIRKKWPQLSLGVLALFLFLALVITIALSSSFFTKKISIFKPSDNIFNIDKDKDDNKEIKKPECENCYSNLLTGIEQKNEFGFPVAVVIDNHIDARPPASLSQAHIVYELPVEGSITRYLAVYDSGQDLDKIGPVRSARPYMLDYVQELSALFVHVGGSPQALIDIAKDNIFNLNEFYNGDIFIRDENRPKPHYIFIDFDNIKNYIITQNREKPVFYTWNFKKDSENINLDDSDDLDTDINIDFGADAYEVNWVYDFENNNYLRSLNNKVHVDDNNIDIKAKNIIIQRVNSEVLDEKLRLRINTISEGEAVICFEAQCREGTWKKDSAKARTRYYVDGKEIDFSVGNFWIEILDQNGELEY